MMKNLEEITKAEKVPDRHHRRVDQPQRQKPHKARTTDGRIELERVLLVATPNKRDKRTPSHIRPSERHQHNTHYE